MNTDNISLTAEIMREVALHSDHSITPELDRMIRDAAHSGKFEIIIGKELSKETIKALLHRGFTVEHTYHNSDNFENVMDKPQSYTIGWV